MCEVHDNHALLERIGVLFELVGFVEPTHHAHHRRDLLDLERAVPFPHDVPGYGAGNGLAFQRTQFVEPVEVTAHHRQGTIVQDFLDRRGVETEHLRHGPQLPLVQQVAFQRVLVVLHRGCVRVGEERPRIDTAIFRPGVALGIEHVHTIVLPHPFLAGFGRGERTLEDAGSQLARVLNHVTAPRGVKAFGQLIVDLAFHRLAAAGRFLHRGADLTVKLALCRCRLAQLMRLGQHGQALVRRSALIHHLVVLIHGVLRLRFQLLSLGCRGACTFNEVGDRRGIDAPVLVVVGEQHVRQARFP